MHVFDTLHKTQIILKRSKVCEMKGAGSIGIFKIPIWQCIMTMLALRCVGIPLNLHENSFNYKAHRGTSHPKQDCSADTILVLKFNLFNVRNSLKHWP